VPENRYGVAGWRYAFYWFPDHLEPGMVLDRVQKMLRDTGDWNIGRPGGSSYRTWVHLPSGEEVAMVAAGLRPLVMSVGARPSGAPTDQIGGVPIVISAVDHLARELGGRDLADGGVMQLVERAQRDYEQWTQDQQRIAQLTVELTTRPCPSCGKRVESSAARCRLCGYRFSAADDLARDAQTSQSAGELRRLQSGLSATAAKPPVYRPVGRR
jgi:hypothetical protein